MKRVDQIVFKDGIGDCFRACVASIFEFPIDRMPNFWEQTQESSEFWNLVNKWTTDNLGYKCIVVKCNKDTFCYIEGLTCIAMGNVSRGDKEHSIVWCDGVIHDPHPSRTALSSKPNIFAIFAPLDIATNK